MQSVLREDIGARYKCIRRIPFRGNSARCLILRQRYAKFMLDLLAGDVRVINIDQTWLSDTMLKRRKWRRRGELNSMNER